MLTAAFMEGWWWCYKWEDEKGNNEYCSFYIKSIQSKVNSSMHLLQMHSTDRGGISVFRSHNQNRVFTTENYA